MRVVALILLSILLVSIVVAAVRTNPWYLTAVVAALALVVYRARRGDFR